MSAKDPKSVKSKTGADLRAQAEARLSAQVGPKAEASSRADVIRAGLTSYAATMDRIAEAYRREDWKVLGYDSFNAYAGGEFGDARLKLTPEQRAQILPAFLAVGMSKRGAAAALGVDDKTIRNDLKGADNSAPREKSPLVSAMRQAIEDAQTAAGESNTPTDGGNEPVAITPEASPASGSVPAFPGDGPDVTPEDTPAADPVDQVALVAPQQPGSDSSPEASEASPQGEAPADGTVNPSPEEGLAVAAPAEPGIEPPLAGGEAPMEGKPSAAGATPPLGSGQEMAGGEAVEGEAGHSSSTDPELPSTDPAHVVEVFTEWADWVDGYDSEALGPLFTDEQLEQLNSAVTELEKFVDALERCRTP